MHSFGMTESYGTLRTDSPLFEHTQQREQNSAASKRGSMHDGVTDALFSTSPSGLRRARAGARHRSLEIELFDIDRLMGLEVRMAVTSVFEALVGFWWQRTGSKGF